MLKKISFFIILLFVNHIVGFSQENILDEYKANKSKERTLLNVEKENSVVELAREYKVRFDVKDLDVHMYKCAPLSDKGHLYYWFQLLVDSKSISAIDMNQTGTIVASTTSRELNFWKQIKKNELVGSIKCPLKNKHSISYNYNGELIAVAGEGNQVYIYKTQDMNLKEADPFLIIESTSNDIIFAPFKNILVIGKDHEIVFWDIDKNKQLDNLKLSGSAQKVQYEKSGKYIACLNSNNEVIVWDAKTYSMLKIFKENGAEIHSLDFHPNGMYLTAGTNKGEIITWNIRQKKEYMRFKAFDSSVKAMKYIYDANLDKAFLVTGADKRIATFEVTKMIPDFNVLVKDYVADSMEKWEKKGKYESSDMYSKRISKERDQKLEEVQQEAINFYAEKYRGLKYPSIGAYDPDLGIFPFAFDNTNEIFIKVPNEEAADFEANLPILDIVDISYGLTAENDFTIKTIEIFNPDNKKHYYYGSKVIERLDALVVDVAPVEVTIAVANAEEDLKKKMEIFTSKMKLNKQLSDNIETNIQAKVEIEEDEESGEKQMNLHIEYAYNIIRAKIGIQTTDYPPGQYVVTKSKAASSIMKILQETIDNDLVKYFKQGNKVTFKITGHTDGSPIVKPMAYDERYGVYDDVPFFLNGNLESLTLSRETGIATNAQLAFLRTMGIRYFVENYIDAVSVTENKFQHYAVVSKEKGEEHRKIEIEVIIHDAFEEGKEKLNRPKMDIPSSDVDINIPEIDEVDEHTYAVVVGNEDYRSFNNNLEKGVNVKYAKNDAQIFKSYLVKTLGIPERNVELVVNGTWGNIWGAIDNINYLVELDDKAKIIFFYAGHGLPHEKTKEPYLIPIDVNPGNIERGGIALRDLCNGLYKNHPERVTLFLDACFSGGARDKALVEARAVAITPKIEDSMLKNNTVAFYSSQGDETSVAYDEKEHGLFTYFLLKKLKQSKCEVTVKDLNDFLFDNVSKTAISVIRKKQRPTMDASLDLKTDENYLNWPVFN